MWYNIVQMGNIIRIVSLCMLLSPVQVAIRENCKYVMRRI